ncbi:MAG: rhodanese-like domain-containing protein [Actinomycetaceae bacterium]|nr:rhodanese-like domain-containing protein [Actinomycetaceae bacterium]MDY6082525.1 rhodanese-like domain-containing protein [Actinomycetaceae bacterium]
MSDSSSEPSFFAGNRGTSPEISVQQAQQMIADGAAFVDVRETWEFDRAHATGAVNIPLGTLPQHAQDFAGSSAVVVICASGNRSRFGANIIRSAGTPAYSVIGGTEDWMELGGPMTFSE